MRVSKEQAAQNRERIIDEAARLFRERGVQGVGVDALGEAAGLTVGSLYSQFGSKDRLLAEAVTRAFQSFGAKFEAIDNADAYFAKYLSADHRDHPGDGCVVAALGSEVPRQSEPVRSLFTDALRKRVARLARLLPDRRGRNRDRGALAALATMVGGMVLARAVDDPDYSDEILKAVRDHLGAFATELGGTRDRVARSAQRGAS